MSEYLINNSIVFFVSSHPRLFTALILQLAFLLIRTKRLKDENYQGGIKLLFLIEQWIEVICKIPTIFYLSSYIVKLITNIELQKYLNDYELGITIILVICFIVILSEKNIYPDFVYLLTNVQKIYKSIKSKSNSDSDKITTHTTKKNNFSTQSEKESEIEK